MGPERSRGSGAKRGRRAGHWKERPARGSRAHVPTGQSTRLCCRNGWW